MISVLSLITTANGEPLPLPETNLSKYTEVSRFLEETSQRAKELIGQGAPLIDSQISVLHALKQFSISMWLKPGTRSNFPSHLRDDQYGYYPFPREMTFKRSHINASNAEPYGHLLIWDDAIVSNKQAGDQWSYCYGGVRRYTNPGKTYDVEFVEVEEMRARIHEDEDDVHPKESTCIVVRHGKWSSEPIRPLGKRADALRKEYGEFAGFKEKDLSKTYHYEPVKDEIFRSKDGCESLGDYPGFTFDNKWLKPELDTKVDWEEKAGNLCEFLAGYDGPENE